MAESRNVHSCAILEPGKKVIVSGGADVNGRSKKTSEIFDIASKTWIKGPDLPVATISAKMITVDAVTYHIGGIPTRK